MDTNAELAVIDLVAHLYAGSSTERQALARMWCAPSIPPHPARPARAPCPAAPFRELTPRARASSLARHSGRFPRRQKYSADSEAERKQRGFETVRAHHQTLSRMFEDDPSGECLSLDDLRTVWEEYVDALRTASAMTASESAGVSDPRSYHALEKPLIKRNASFGNFVDELTSVASPGGSTHGIKRISSKGMLLGVGCSSRETSAHGGGEFQKALREREALKE